MLILEQSVSIDIRLGPFVAVGDGFTPITAAQTISNWDQGEVLKENGAATVSMAGAIGAVTGCGGWYDYTVAVGDVDTVGEVVFVCQDASVFLPVYVRAMVVEEAVYTAFYESAATGVPALGALEATVGNVETDTQDLQTQIGTAGAGLTNVGASGNDWNTVTPDAAGVAPTAQEIEDEVWNALQSAHVGADSMGVIASEIATAQLDLDTITGSDGVTLATAQALYAPNVVVPDAAGVAPTAAEIETEVWDGLQSAHVIADSMGAMATELALIPTTKTGYSLTATTGLGDQTADITGNLSGSVGSLTGHTNQTADHTAGIADIPTVAEFEARTPTVAQLAYIVANAAIGVPVTITTAGGSTTACVFNLVDGSAGDATDDHYNGRILVFDSGSLAGQATDITDYTGSGTVATITAITEAPTSSHTARLI